MKTDDIQLMAYVDGELPPQERDEVEREIDVSPELAERVALLKASRLPYRQAFANQTLPPVPESLTKKIEELARAAQAGQPSSASANDAVLKHGVHLPPSAPIRSRLRNAPAWLAVAFVAGVVCGGAILRLAPGVAPGIGANGATLASATMGASPWVRAAANYQQLYTRDTVAQIEPDTDLSAKTVDQIRRTDGLALRIPDLRAAGLTFKGVQRLRFNNKPLVQIVYLPAQGDPVALCVMKDVKPDQTIAQQRVDKMDVVTWRQAELSYALIGAPGNVDLPALAKQISDSRVGSIFSEATLARKAFSG
jgi:anti-sigma factor RsiW